MEKKKKYFKLGEEKFEITGYEDSWAVLNSGLPWILDLILDSLDTLANIFLRYDSLEIPIVYVIDNILMDDSFKKSRFNQFGKTKAHYTLLGKKDLDMFDTFPSEYKKFFYNTIMNLGNTDIALFYTNSFTKNIYVRRLNKKAFFEYYKTILTIMKEDIDSELIKAETEKFVNGHYSYRQIYMKVWKIFEKKMFVIEKNFPSKLKFGIEKKYKIRVRIKETGLIIFSMTFLTKEIVYKHRKPVSETTNKIAFIKKYKNYAPITNGVASFIAFKYLEEECKVKKIDYILLPCEDPLNCYYFMNMGFINTTREEYNEKFGDVLKYLLFNKESYKDLREFLDETYGIEKKYFLGSDDRIYLMKILSGKL